MSPFTKVSGDYPSLIDKSISTAGQRPPVARSASEGWRATRDGIRTPEALGHSTMSLASRLERGCVNI